VSLAASGVGLWPSCLALPRLASLALPLSRQARKPRIEPGSKKACVTATAQLVP
jgi:hypothetical protein